MLLYTVPFAFSEQVTTSQKKKNQEILGDEVHALSPVDKATLITA